MLETMKLEVLSRETIKPSSPTPPHLRTLDLSYFDVMTPPVYTGGLIFYTNNGVTGDDTKDISVKLKKSLSETLTRFYPFAGRIDGKVIDCNDEGAVFIEARVGSSLSDLLVNPNPPCLIDFLPDGRPKAAMWPLLLVQVTFFSCGGFVVGTSLSHRVSDATALSIFMRGWSATAKGLGDTVAPDFPAAKVFPSPPDQETIVIPEKNVKGKTKEPEFVTRRFVFEAEKIKSLKSRAESEEVRDPTRFEVITALLWQCALKTRRSKTGYVKRPSVLQFPLDMRRRNISPVLSGNAVGNIISMVNVEVEDNEMGLKELVRKLREDKKKEVMNLDTIEAMEMAKEFEEKVKGFFYRKIIGVIDGYSSTSWGRSGFYELDLGFGNPIWVTPDSFNTDVELFVSLDTRDGQGTEVWVNLKVEEMSEMEKDDELLEFAVLNPSVVV